MAPLFSAPPPHVRPCAVHGGVQTFRVPSIFLGNVCMKVLFRDIVFGILTPSTETTPNVITS